MPVNRPLCTTAVLLLAIVIPSAAMSAMDWNRVRGWCGLAPQFPPAQSPSFGHFATHWQQWADPMPLNAGGSPAAFPFPSGMQAPIPGSYPAPQLPLGSSYRSLGPRNEFLEAPPAPFIPNSNGGHPLPANAPAIPAAPLLPRSPGLSPTLPPPPALPPLPQTPSPATQDVSARRFPLFSPQFTTPPPLPAPEAIGGGHQPIGYRSISMKGNILAGKNEAAAGQAWSAEAGVQNKDNSPRSAFPPPRSALQSRRVPQPAAVSARPSRSVGGSYRSRVAPLERRPVPAHNYRISTQRPLQSLPTVPTRSYRSVR